MCACIRDSGATMSNGPILTRRGREEGLCVVRDPLSSVSVMLYYNLSCNQRSGSVSASVFSEMVPAVQTG